MGEESKVAGALVGSLAGGVGKLVGVAEVAGRLVGEEGLLD